MSLAMFAAPFNDIDTDNSDNIINKKRQSHSRTQKIYPKENFDTKKVNSILNKIHNSDEDDDDTDTFNPPPKAESVGVQKTISLPQKEQMSNMINETQIKTLGRAPQPMYEGDDNLELNDYNNYGDEKTNEEYYKRIIPGYEKQKNATNRPYYYNKTNYVSETPNSDILIQKLNYMISLLEDKHDEKTDNVTEEVVLYSFLGIFIIFIADTFVKAGKYIR